jgi:hypothetical protein
VLETFAGVVVALIALISSYDHITLPGRIISVPKQWGGWFIALSLPFAPVVTAGFCEAVAQLAA